MLNYNLYRVTELFKFKNVTLLLKAKLSRESKKTSLFIVFQSKLKRVKRNQLVQQEQDRVSSIQHFMEI